MIGVIDILRDNAGVGALVGGTGTSARVYPIERAQKEGLPAITVDQDNVIPYDTKDGVSTLDEVYVLVISYGSTYSDSLAVANACRSALDRTSGTFNGEVIQSIRFQSQSTNIEEINNVPIYWTEQEYKVRIER